ncbi:carboxypeptidase-like regulatory domain-containing protein [Hymenobacter sp. BT635]|uniref:Carboxypeptidase-like regulatory domain-containing protein n=1 Tax=Hymenobacter nitidus TaxID=2880929 RepID=A0ABS8A9I5_9BACT|nr:carboxypeptidase-like regulatory domain-containing protein [Hymenobacter nitidus]MCB2376597.1 carboxypeptidase-like regulatory domain-containing protein [Hymenobacter nitidus]
MLSFRPALSFALVAALTLASGTGFAAATGPATAGKPAAQHPKKRPATPKTGKVAKLAPLLIAPTTDILHDHSPVTLSGWVTGADGMPLPGATVWLTNTRRQTTVTNRQGDFILALPNNAPVSLTIGCAGYQEQVVMLSQPREQNGVNVALRLTARRP